MLLSTLNKKHSKFMTCVPSKVKLILNILLILSLSEFFFFGTPVKTCFSLVGVGKGKVSIALPKCKTFPNQSYVNDITKLKYTML